MVGVFQTPLDAETIKAKARALGADLVGIADGAVMDAHPPDPRDPRRPKDITEHDGGRAIVLAKRYSAGTTRIARWDERHKYYNDELVLTMLEETSLELVFWLEDNGYPAIIIPPTHADPWLYRGDRNQHMTTVLSLTHAAVEAGLGTLGLNCSSSPRSSARAFSSPRCFARSIARPTDGGRRRSASARNAAAA